MFTVAEMEAEKNQQTHFCSYSNAPWETSSHLTADQPTAGISVG